jgi:hypothetical protein
MSKPRSPARRCSEAGPPNAVARVARQA